MDGPRFVDELRRRVAGPAGERLGDAPLADRLAADLERARGRWPDADAGEAFLGYVVERIARESDLGALARLRLDDLLLAWWAGGGTPAAIAAFEAAHDADLARLERRFHRLPADELRQQLRIKLFVGGEHPPRIRDYSGFGFLQNWLRVTAVRSFVDLARREEGRRHEAALEEVDLFGVHDPTDDPRLRHLREELGHAAKRAFAAAVATLAPRQKLFLRHAHVDRLTLDQIAATYRVHRATVARTLAAAREHLLDVTRAELASTLGVPADQLASVVGLIGSQLELSLSRVLASEPAGGG